jgi:parallel beta-helix repeat protein
MKRKIISILFALVLMLSLSLVMAAPAAAATAVTNVWVSFASTGNNISNAAVYTIYFTPTTALQRGIDTITVAFPDGIDLTMGAYTFDLSGAQTTATYYTFGADGLVATSAATLWNTSYQRVNITTPVDMAAGTAGYFVISASAVIKTAATAGSYNIKLWTSKDATPVLSSAFPVDGSTVSSIATYSGYPSSSVAGAASAYKFTFTSATAVTTAGTITVQFPLLTYLPATIATSAVIAGDDATGLLTDDPNATAVTVDTTQRTVTVTPGEALGADTNNYVYFAIGAGILNPTLAGVKTISVWTSTDGKKLTSGTVATIVAGAANKLAFTTTSDDATIINAFSQVMVLQAQDAYGNINTAETTTVLVSATTGTGTVHTAAGSSNPWGASQALTAGTINVYYLPTTAGTHVLTASVVLGTAMTAGTRTVYVAPAVVLKDAGGTTINSYCPAALTYTADLLGVTYIQAAITAASAGDTVELGSGIYELSTAINLNKAITLKAATGTSPIIRNTATITQALSVGTAGSLIHPIVIDGLTFQRLALGAEIRTAIYNNGYDYVTVQNCTFNYIEPNQNAMYQGVVYIGQSSTITSATVSNNTFNSCVTSWPNTDDGYKSGCIIFSTHGGDYRAAISGVTISGNTLTGCNQYGIAFGGYDGTHLASCTISNNIITNGQSPIDLCDFLATVTLTGNTITGAYSYGIKVEGTHNTLVTIKTNSITGTAGTGAALQIEEDGTGAVIVQYNDLYNNNGSAIAATAAYDCRYNYYGSASGPGLLLVSGTTVTSPWLYVSKATVVAANADSPAVSRTLAVGWNTFSTPAKLITAADSIDELVPTGSSIAYYYSGGWQQVTTGYVLTPCNAIYIKMTTAQTALLKIDGATTYVPSKDLAAGWNLIGQANLTGAETDLQAVASVAANYGQLVSPSLNAVAWINTSSTASTGSLVLGEGYWIFMKTAATIGGFTICPIAPDLD